MADPAVMGFGASGLGLVDDPDGLCGVVLSRLEASLRNLIQQGVEEGLLPGDAVKVVGHRTDQLSPTRFLQYFDLGERLMADDVEGALAAVQDLGAPTCRLEAEIIGFDRVSLGRDADRLERLIFGERAPRMGLSAPPAAELERISEQHRSARGMLDDLAPAIGDEYRSLVRLAIVAAPDPAGRETYGSASSLAALGLFLVHPANVLTVADHLGVLVHECTHMVLHALTGDERLTLNDDADRFRSPLRPDARPMEGVVHAMVVCARMAATHRRWARADSADAAIHHERANGLLARFDDGVTVVEPEARWSALGERVWNRTRAIVHDAR